MQQQKDSWQMNKANRLDKVDKTLKRPVSVTDRLRAGVTWPRTVVVLLGASAIVGVILFIIGMVQLKNSSSPSSTETQTQTRTRTRTLTHTTTGTDTGTSATATSSSSTGTGTSTGTESTNTDCHASHYQPLVSKLTPTTAEQRERALHDAGGPLAAVSKFIGNRPHFVVTNANGQLLGEVQDFTQCAALCLQNNSCAAYSYDKRKEVCRLFGDRQFLHGLALTGSRLNIRGAAEISGIRATAKVESVDNVRQLFDLRDQRRFPDPKSLFPDSFADEQVMDVDNLSCVECADLASQDPRIKAFEFFDQHAVSSHSREKSKGDHCHDSEEGNTSFSFEDEDTMARNRPIAEQFRDSKFVRWDSSKKKLILRFGSEREKFEEDEKKLSDIVSRAHETSSKVKSKCRLWRSIPERDGMPTSSHILVGTKK